MDAPSSLLTKNIQKDPGEPPRSPQWDATRTAFVEKFPHCVVCAASVTHTSGQLNVHHIVPFDFVIHVGRPDLELDDRNLITLCELGENGNHHLVVGHLDDWKTYNVTVRSDAVRDDCHGQTADKIKTLVWWLQERALHPAPLASMTPEQKTKLKALLDKMYPR